MKFNRLVTLIIFFMSLIACHNNPCPESVNGTVKDLAGLDGCGLIIELENGKKLIPMNLEAFEYNLVDGTEVRLHYSVQEDAMGICMAGDIIKINCMVLK